MYVNAPSRSTNGTTTVTHTVQVTKSDGFPGPRYQSVQEALSHAHDYNNTFTAGTSSTTRANMQSGRVGRGKFVITPYSGFYSRSEIISPIILVSKSRTGGDHVVELHYPRFGSSGGFNTGVTCHNLDIESGGNHWQALYNKGVIANLQNRCLAEAKNKLNKNEISLAGSLAGADKTILMVAERVTQVVLAWRQTKRGNFKAAAKTLGLTRSNLNFTTPAKAWLELQYGWRPLLTDIYNGMDQTNFALKSDGSHIKAARRLGQDLMVRPIELRNPGADAFGDISTSQRAEVSVEVKFQARVNDATLAYLNSLQVVNPLTFAWENLPFSFVVDWLLPVGDWLNSITAPLGLTFVSGYRTTRIWGDWSFKASSKGQQQPLLYALVHTEGVAAANFRSAKIDRLKYLSWPVASLYFRLPSTSPERIANAVSLVAVTNRIRG